MEGLGVKIIKRCKLIEIIEVTKGKHWKLNPKMNQIVNGWHHENLNKTAYNCDANDDPKYWLNKLQSKEKIIQECAIRKMGLNVMWKKTNNDIIQELISLDRSHNAR